MIMIIRGHYTMSAAWFVTFLVLLESQFALSVNITDITDPSLEAITNNESSTVAEKPDVLLTIPPPRLFINTPVLVIGTEPPRHLVIHSLPDHENRLLRLTLRTDHVCGQKGLCRKGNNWECEIPDYTCHQCRCDEDCFGFGDCCPDMYTSTDPEIQSPDDSCIPGAVKPSNYIQSKRYLMSDRCTNTSDGDLKHKCKTSELGPVYSPTLGRHYTNRFCAMCEGVGDTVPWLSKGICAHVLNYSRINTEEDFFTEVSENPQCGLLYSPPEGIVARECTYDSYNMVSRCPSDWKNQRDVQDCELYHHPVSLGNRTFRNLACAVCNDIVIDRRLNSCDSSIRLILAILPISTMVKNNSADIQDKTSEDECPHLEVYDIFLGVCRRLYCPAGRVIKNHTCVDIFTSAKGLAYKLDFNLMPEDPKGALLYVKDLPALFTEYRAYSSYLAEYAESIFEKTQISITFGTPTIFRWDTMREGLQVHNIKVKTRLVVKRAVQRSYFENLMLDHVRHGWSFYNLPHDEVKVFHSQWLTEDDGPDILTIGDRFMSESEFGNVSKETWMYSGGRSWAPIPSEYMSDPDVYLPVNELMLCNLIELGPNEFVKNEDNSIKEVASGKVHSLGHYVTMEKSVRVCTDFTGQIQKINIGPSVGGHDVATVDKRLQPLVHTSTVKSSHFNLQNESSIWNRTELPVTVSCTGLSLLCILLTILVLVFCSRPYTLPARNNMALFVNLFSAQLVLLIAMVVPVSDIMCRILGAVVHYFWLTTFSWILACCYLMYLIFTKPFNRNNASKTSLQFCLICQCVPLVFVAFYITGNIIQSRSVGYDLMIVVDDTGAQFCFFSSTLQFVIGLAAPLALLILITLYFLTRALYAIPLDKASSLNDTTSDGKLPKAYRTIFVMLVCTWSFATLAITIADIYLWYVFIIVNSSLGEFVVYCFFSLIRCSKERMTYDPDPAADNDSEASCTKPTDIAKQ